MSAASESFFNLEISPQDNSITQDILGTTTVFKVEPSGNFPICIESSPSPKKVKVDTKDGHDPSSTDDNLNSEHLKLGNSSPPASYPLDKPPFPTGESNAAPTARTDSKSLPRKPAKVQMRGGQRKKGVKQPRSSSPDIEIIVTPQKQKKSKPEQQPTKKRSVCCSADVAHLCEVCSKEDCNECSNCM